ncbi:LCP family protein [Mycobacterium sp. OTB74]|jgi:LCP family protein required for cell wall assembly|uniref:LCP family protein n=1 Tax=Mycobacterium sp. OTB74 TaxID=1853452 RepID=UPI002475D7BF|nr:LCP family protein [Mycobacterium sp. OTB74]MDH6243331.1 LCP family protein required for cell wall assembly [Mycobacterium sp. OTB74]
MRQVIALVSAAVLALTGIGWWGVHGVINGFTISHALGIDLPGSGNVNGPMNILLIGLDSRRDQDGNELPQDLLDELHAGDSDSGGYNTNTLILVHVTPDNHVVAFSIPRDDYVAVDDIPGYRHIKIKEAYGLKKAEVAQKLNDEGITDQHELETKGREAGRSATISAVRDLTGVKVNYFAEISLAGFYDLASALGGIDVCLNNAVQDTDFSGADFPAGPQTLNPSQALAFVRQRHNLDNGDLDRTHRQQAFLASVMHKLQSGGVFSDLGKFSNLMSVARKDVVLSPGWTNDVFRRLGSVSGDNIQYRTLPVLRYDTVNGQDVNIIDQDAIRTQVSAAFSDDPDASTTPAPPASTVDVINGGEMTGLAAAVASALTSHGFTAGDVRNSQPGEPTDTQIDYGPGSASDARQVADQLAITATPTPSDKEQPGHIRIILGNSYDPPAAIADAQSSGATPVGAPSSGNQDSDAPDQGKPMSGNGIPCVN